MKLSDQLTALGGIFVVIIIGFGLLLWLSPSQGTTSAQTFSRAQLVAPDSAMTGTTTAKVTVVEWGDFQCPSCGAEEPVIKQIISTYGKNPEFNFVFRNFPLAQHPNAKPAAEAAGAARAQGKYWEMYTLLYEHQNDWVNLSNPRSVFDGYAKSLGMSASKFDSALDTQTYAPLVARDLAQAQALGLNHTPTIFVNGIEVLNPQLSALTKAIDDALKK